MADVVGRVLEEEPDDAPVNDAAAHDVKPPVRGAPSSGSNACSSTGDYGCGYG